MLGGRFVTPRHPDYRHIAGEQSANLLRSAVGEAEPTPACRAESPPTTWPPDPLNTNRFLQIASTLIVQSVDAKSR